MQIRSRKFIGAVVLMAFIFLYALAAMVFGAVVIATLPRWPHFVYFVVAGLAWVPPAMVMIGWMQKPD